MTDFNENASSIDLIQSDPNATFYFLQNGIGKERRNIFTKAFERFHLRLIDSPHNARFIIADEQFDVPKVFSILKIDPPEAIVVRTQWLSDSLKAKQLVPLTKDYIVRPPLIRKQTVPSFSQESVPQQRQKRTLSDDQPQGGSATQVKQRRYSSDEDDDHDFDEVR